MNIIVLGASGLVGSNIVRRFREGGLDVVGTYHTTQTDETSVQLNITNEEAISELVADHDPDAIVNAAAFADVDACELKRDRAWAVNTTGTRNAAVAAAEADAHFIHISTDYVFGGGPNEAPYAETDPPCPLNYYGATKRA
ncbi:SDR family oxidoreductase (plasmid) [Haloarcula sp. NS06]|uniref:SDR family oxidoreductase n=1 Tax=Haloarcula sp. NS06 TaxID=3409688 RepID=UPI003DA6F829